MSAESTKDRVKQYIRENINERIVIKRLIYYIFDDKTRNALLYQDTALQNDWKNPDTNELYTLKDVAMYYDGIPVYIVKKGFNFSIGFDFETHGKDNIKLVEKGYTPDDMEAVLNSQTTNRLFRTIRKLDTSMIIAFILSHILSIVITILVCVLIVHQIYG